MDATTLMIGLLAGSFGMGYIVYGKKQTKAIPLIAGIGLCVIPYFVENIPMLLLACLALIIAPFVIRM